MNFIFVGLIAGVLGSVPVRFGEQWLKWMVIRLVTYSAIWTGVAYFAMPQLIGPFWGLGLTFMIIASHLVSLVVYFIKSESHKSHGRQVPSTSSSSGQLMLVGCLLLLPMGRGCAGCGAFNDTAYRAFAGDNMQTKKWEDDMSPVDVVHIRMVDEAQARWRGKKVLGQVEGSLGSRYQVGNYAIQKTNG